MKQKSKRRIEPRPGQESVWDYPRPPAVEVVSRHVQVVFAGVTIFDVRRVVRVLETSHPPVYYLPRDEIRGGARLDRLERRTICEFKGAASYDDVVLGEERAIGAAWGYDQPWPGYEALIGHVALYPSMMQACFVDSEQVEAQAGDFYGGWITSEIVGPFKGGPGTWGW